MRPLKLFLFFVSFIIAGAFVVFVAMNYNYSNIQLDELSEGNIIKLSKEQQYVRLSQILDKKIDSLCLIRPYSTSTNDDSYPNFSKFMNENITPVGEGEFYILYRINGEVKYNRYTRRIIDVLNFNHEFNLDGYIYKQVVCSKLNTSILVMTIVNEKIRIGLSTTERE